MYSYTLDGVSFDAVDSPIIGIEGLTRKIQRSWSGTDINNTLRVFAEGTVSLTNSAFNYFCSKFGNGLCEPIEIEIFDKEGQTFYSGTIYSYTAKINITKKTVDVELKDTSWSSILRNRANQEVWIRSERTINCEPIDRCRFRLVEFKDVNGNPYAGYRLGFNVLEVLDYLARFLTDNQVTVQSNFLQTVEYGIYTSKVMLTNTITPPGFVSLLTDEEVYPTVSFSKVFEELRKKDALYIMVDGNTIIIEPESYFFDTSTVLSISEFTYDTTLSTDSERLLAGIKTGQTDIEVVNQQVLYPFPERPYLSWREDFFNSCNCEIDKDAELDLVSDFIVDGNQIFTALLGDDYEDRLFLIHTDFKLPFSEAIQTFNGANGFYYYNDRLRNPNVLERWQTFAANCLYDVRQSGVQFELFCNPLIDGFACVQSPIAGNTPRIVKGYQTYIDPQDVVIDTDNGYPTNLSLPTDFIPGGSFGYKIPVEAYYIFEAQGYWELIVPSPVDAASCTISIVVYQDDTGAVEIYRKDETLNFTNTGSLVNQIQYVLSDFILLPAGSVVIVELTSSVTNSTPVLVSQTFQKEFFRFSDAINCFDLPRTAESYPYKYEFSLPVCASDFDAMAANNAGKINLAGIDTWISEVTQKINGDTTFSLLSNTSICCNE